MDNLLDHFGQFVIAYPTWRFFIVAGAILIQGELAILLSLYLVQGGSLTWSSFLVPALCGLFLGEGFVYFLGKTMRMTRFGWRWYYKLKGNRRLQTYTYFLKTNMAKLFIIAKFIPATNFVIIFLAGWSKTKFGQFIKSYTAGVLIWFAAITAVAYPFTSGLYYLRTTKVFRKAEIGIAVVLFVIFAAEFFLRKILKRASLAVEKSADIGRFVEEEIKRRESAASETENKNLTADK